MLLIALFACRGPNTVELPSDSEDATDSQPTETGQDSGPCTPEPAEPGQSVGLSLSFDGVERSYRLHLPSDYDCSPRPLIIGLHGYYGSGKGFEESTSRMASTIDARGIIGLFPDGLPMGESGWQAQVTSFNDIDSHHSEGPDGPTCTEDAYDYGVYDNCPAEESADACNWGTSCADDEGFLRALIAQVQGAWSVDAKRIYLTGFSQGGQSAQSLGSRLSDLLAAVSPQHGFATNGYTVGPESALGLFQVWGDKDRIVDGHDRPSNDGMIYDGAEETAQVWAAAQGCADTATEYPTDYDGTQGWACVEHAGCSTGAEVVSCVWNGGHTWGRGGGTNFALGSMLSFFDKHERQP